MKVIITAERDKERPIVNYSCRLVSLDGNNVAGPIYPTPSNMTRDLIDMLDTYADGPVEIEQSGDDEFIKHIPGFVELYNKRLERRAKNTSVEDKV